MFKEKFIAKLFLMCTFMNALRYIRITLHAKHFTIIQMCCECHFLIHSKKLLLKFAIPAEIKAFLLENILIPLSNMPSTDTESIKFLLLHSKFTTICSFVTLFNKLIILYGDCTIISWCFQFERINTFSFSDMKRILMFILDKYFRAYKSLMSLSTKSLHKINNIYIVLVVKMWFDVLGKQNKNCYKY